MTSLHFIFSHFFLHARSHIIRPLHPGLLLLLGHGNPSCNLVQALFHYPLLKLMTLSFSLMYNNAGLEEGGRQCAIEITSISLTGAHSALPVRAKKWEVAFCCSEAMKAFKTKIGLAVTNESK